MAETMIAMSEGVFVRTRSLSDLMQHPFYRELSLGIVIGLLAASLCLNVYFFVMRIDPSFLPLVLDRFFYAAPTVESTEHILGARGAPVIIVEYADYQCAYCKMMNDRFKRLVQQDKQVAWVMRNRPLPTHRYAEIASEAAECANEQGAFWAYNDFLFEHQESLVDPGIFWSGAEQLHLDEQKFQSCFRSARYAHKVGEDLLSARERGINQTPTFYINDQRFDGAISPEQLQRIVEAQLTETQEISK
jgi:predicted DsbA family dithiol-disulfide isomerase